MITSAWAMGVVFTIAVFAGKAGLVAGSARLGWRGLIALALLYGLAAFAMGVGLSVVNPMDYFAVFQRFMAWGVGVHFLLSVGLIVWGWSTMRTATGQTKRRPVVGYLLMLPCPVCLSAMLLSCSIFVALTGADPIRVGTGMAFLFIAVILSVALLAGHLMKRGRDERRSELLLGFIMLLTGLYFAASIIIVPVYAKAKALFSIPGAAVGPQLSLRDASILFLIAGFVSGLGFLAHHRRKSLRYGNRDAGHLNHQPGKG
jgi:predicted transporter